MAFGSDAVVDDFLSALGFGSDRGSQPSPGTRHTPGTVDQATLQRLQAGQQANAPDPFIGRDPTYAATVRGIDYEGNTAESNVRAAIDRMNVRRAFEQPIIAETGQIERRGIMQDREASGLAQGSYTTQLIAEQRRREIQEQAAAELDLAERQGSTLAGLGSTVANLERQRGEARGLAAQRAADAELERKTREEELKIQYQALGLPWPG